MMTRGLGLRPSSKSPLVKGASGILIIIVVLVIYAPSLRAGFRFVDDYTYLYWAGSMPVPQYLAFTVDPRLQNINYRPLRRILVLMEYELFHSDAVPYHVAQIMIHAANALFVLEIVWRVSKKWRLAFLSGLFFAALPVASEAVFWVSDEAPLATFFVLAAVLMWADYLQTGDTRRHLLGVGALVFALLSKESSLATPVVLFLVDRLLIRERTNFVELFRRYALILLVTVIYLAIQYNIQSKGTFAHEGGYRIGPHIVSNYAAYFAMLMLPWNLQYASSGAMFLWIAGLVIIIFALLMRSRVLTFLVLSTVLAIGPVVFASLGPGARYLYLATIPLAVLWALLVESVKSHRMPSGLSVVISTLLVCLVILSGSNVAEAAAQLAEASRQTRVPFRDIMQQHPALSEDTRFFLVEPPDDPSMTDIAGMFFLRYGKQVSVGGTFHDGRLYTGGRLAAEKARLREYATAYVYFFHDTRRPIQVPVDKRASTRATQQIPSDFAAPIRLEGYEVTSSELKRDHPLVLILYWRATGRIEKDYIVFVHILDSDGRLIVGEDSAPRSGNERTTEWKPDQFTADAHILSLPPEVTPGDGYRLEVGLYDSSTLQRLSLVDQQGHPVTDKIEIEGFRIDNR